MSGLCSQRGQPAPVHMHPTPQQRHMGSIKIVPLIYCALLASWAGAPGYPHSWSGASARQEQPSIGKQAANKDAQAGIPALPRGKKLVLKDGNFQLVRDYQRNGERVRYLSAERGEWEEIPAAMVDWDATARAAVGEQAEEEAIAKKRHAQEQAQRNETEMDGDARLQVAA